MRASRHNYEDPVRWAAVAAVAVTALCGLIGAHALPANGQSAPEPAAESGQPEPRVIDPQPAPPRPPPGPLRLMSWNVASSPYAIAMRKIKSSAPAWRTSFGSERRTNDAPPPPQSALIDADVVLLQGITNPRALRRLFPRAQLAPHLFAPRAGNVAKGSVFTAPVSSVESKRLPSASGMVFACSIAAKTSTICQPQPRKLQLRSTPSRQPPPRSSRRLTPPRLVSPLRSSIAAARCGSPPSRSKRLATRQATPIGSADAAGALAQSSHGSG